MPVVVIPTRQSHGTPYEIAPKDDKPKQHGLCKVAFFYLLMIQLRAEAGRPHQPRWSHFEARWLVTFAVQPTAFESLFFFSLVLFFIC